MTERLPTFLIIGAAKSGTTALWEAIARHPDVFMPALKEPQFFAFAGQRLDYRGPGASINRAVTDRGAYLDLFRDAGDARAVGEASALYLAVDGTAERIRREIPDVRLVAILRRPAERAYSSYLHLKRDGREPAESFEEALALEERRVADGWGFLWRYRELGFYTRQLEAYRRHFDDAQLLVHLYDDFAADPAAVVRETYRFIGVDPDFVPDLSRRSNVGGAPRRGWRGRVLGRGSPLRSAVAAMLPAGARRRGRGMVDRHVLEREPMRPETDARLTAEFAADVEALGAMLGRDLGAWARADPGG